MVVQRIENNTRAFGFFALKLGIERNTVNEFVTCRCFLDSPVSNEQLVKVVSGVV